MVFLWCFCGGVCVVVFVWWCFVVVFLCFCMFFFGVDFRRITEKLCKEC